MNTSGTPRRTGAAWLLVVLALAACGSDDGDGGSMPGSRSAIVEQPASAPDGFEFSYRARGTTVLDCVLPNRSFDGTVWPSGSLLISSVTPSGPGRALRTGEGVYLEAALFADGSIEERWLRVGRAEMDAVRPRLERILGVDLVSYLMTPGAPPSGIQVVAATLEETDVYSQLEPMRTADGSFAAGYRFVLEGEDAPVLDAWIDGAGKVVRTQVQRSVEGQAGRADPDTGWIIDYRSLGPGADEPSPPDRVVEATAPLLAELTPPTRDGCDLEIGPEPTLPRPPP